MSSAVVGGLGHCGAVFVIWVCEVVVDVGRVGGADSLEGENKVSGVLVERASGPRCSGEYKRESGIHRKSEWT